MLKVVVKYQEPLNLKRALEGVPSVTGKTFFSRLSPHFSSDDVKAFTQTKVIDYRKQSHTARALGGRS